MSGCSYFHPGWPKIDSFKNLQHVAISMKLLPDDWLKKVLCQNLIRKLTRRRFLQKTCTKISFIRENSVVSVVAPFCQKVTRSTFELFFWTPSVSARNVLFWILSPFLDCSKFSVSSLVFHDFCQINWPRKLFCTKSSFLDPVQAEHSFQKQKFPL